MYQRKPSQKQLAKINEKCSPHVVLSLYIGLSFFLALSYEVCFFTHSRYILLSVHRNTMQTNMWLGKPLLLLRTTSEYYIHSVPTKNPSEKKQVAKNSENHKKKKQTWQRGSAAYRSYILLNILTTSASCEFDQFRVDTHLCKLRTNFVAR